MDLITPEEVNKKLHSVLIALQKLALQLEI